MKPTLPLLTALLLAPLAASLAADTPAKPKPATPPEFAAITDDPKLPRVLLVGDSVSIAYALDVRKLLKGEANVHRVPANCGSTKVAFGSYGLVRRLPDANEKWDVIHFNHGLHDLSYRFADDRDKNDQGEYALPTNGGRPNVPLEQYEKHLRQIIARLKQTGAKLVWASTTPIPDDPPKSQTAASIMERNAAAAELMKKHGIATDNLFAAITPHLAAMQNPNDVHFNAKGYDFLGQTVAASVEALLNQKRP